MYQRVSFDDFVKAFWKHDRGGQFSPEGDKALFEYLLEEEEACGKEQELDVIAICSTFAEYSLEELVQNYEYLKFIDRHDWPEYFTHFIPVGEDERRVIVGD